MDNYNINIKIIILFYFYCFYLLYCTHNSLHSTFSHPHHPQSYHHHHHPLQHSQLSPTFPRTFLAPFPYLYPLSAPCQSICSLFLTEPFTYAYLSPLTTPLYTFHTFSSHLLNILSSYSNY